MRRTPPISLASRHGILVPQDKVAHYTPPPGEKAAAAAPPAQPAAEPKPRPIMQPPPASTPKKRSRMQSKDGLQLGERVMSGGHIGYIRYIGEPGGSRRGRRVGIVETFLFTDFAEGMFLGIEFEERVGKHDGKVEGKRYFTCGDGHGVFVRPDRATCRGISCDNLIK